MFLSKLFKKKGQEMDEKPLSQNNPADSGTGGDSGQPGTTPTSIPPAGGEDATPPSIDQPPVETPTTEPDVTPPVETPPAEPEGGDQPPTEPGAGGDNPNPAA